LRVGSLGRRLCVIAMQAAAVIIGGLWGRAVHYPGRPPTALAAVAAVLVLSGLLASLAGRRADGSGHPALASGGCLAYMAGVVLSEPFLMVGSLPAVAGAALVLVPLLLAVSYLARCRAWLSAAGVGLFVFASSAMLAGNAGVSDAGSGFLGYWVS
jgi:hypothetical protein